jgi:hypothetical protein
MDDKEMIMAQIAELRQRLDDLAASSWPKKIQLYLHGLEETPREAAERLGLSPKATETFLNAFYELEVDVLVTADGTAVLTHVGGMPLSAPLKLA